jgi:transketolase
MAIAERHLRARFGAEAVDHHTYVLAGDGCFMEGISHEAGALAGHLGLGRLICVFDDNRITIDGPTSLATSEDVAARFAAYGWHVEYLGEIADDLDALEQALLAAKAVEDRPSLLVLRSHIGHPSPDHTDDHEAHGLAFSAEDISRTKAVMGIPDEPFWAPDELVDAYREAAARRGAEARTAWADRAAAVIEQPDWHAAWSATGVDGWEASLPTFEHGTKLATRVAIKQVLDATLPGLPGLVSGAADLTGNTGTQLAEQSPHTSDDPAGRQLYFGIREHAMGATMVGMALHGGILPVGGTFFVFLDYMRPPVRLAALSGAKVCFVFTHDSVGVGEDGPTHQPVEHLATLRAVPGLQVIRPADANETAEAWRAVVDHDGPTALVLSRQALPVITDGSAVATGAGIVHEPETAPAIVLVGTGSEVAVCLEAARTLAADGIAARVVSMPSWDRFEALPEPARRAVLPADRPVLSVEAATTFGWARHATHHIGIDRFGASAPGAEALERFGISADHVVERVRALIGTNPEAHS